MPTHKFNNKNKHKPECYHSTCRPKNQLQKEKVQLENAKVHNTISEDEAAVANGKLMIKQTFLGVVTTAALSYLRNELDKVTTGNAI